MPLILQADPLPLRVEADGSIRVGDSRVLVEIVIAEHEGGAAPDAIADGYDSLVRADVYAVIAYYLRHREEVAAYLQRRDREALEIRKKLEASTMTQPDFWNELQRRSAERNSGDASAADR
jgi:uncharacterized protein (DUF433 family)